MLRWTLGALLALGLLGRAGAAQTLPVDLDLDYAAFLYSEDQSVLELYLSVGAASLTFQDDGGRFTASLPLRIALYPASASAPAGASDAVVFSDTTRLRFAVADTSVFDGGQYYIEQFRTAVAPGEYTLDVTVPAEGARTELRLSLDVLVPDFVQPGRATVSDVTLASNIREGEADARFYKNGLLITPNPGALFGQEQARVYYYAEAYGLPEATDLDGYTLFAYLSNTERPQPIEGLQRRTSRAVRAPDVLVGAFNVAALPTGSYFLHLALLDENNEALAEQTKRFFVYNPGVERPAATLDEGFETSLYAVMSEEEVEENLAHARVIASQQERAQIQQLGSVEDKRRYLAEFWRRRDTDSDPAENQARRAFYERLRYAEDRYGTPFTEAYRTDRGRVLLVYGYPSQVDPVPFSNQLAPHEVWLYDNISGQGQAVFVFADRQGTGDYDLIHSTVTGEVSAPNWEQLLRR